jgi:hypothetical protein
MSEKVYVHAAGCGRIKKESSVSVKGSGSIG